MARATVKTELRFITAEDLRSQLAEHEARFGVPSDRLADAFRRDVKDGQAPWARGAVAHSPPGDRPDPYPEADITDVLSEILKQLE